MTDHMHHMHKRMAWVFACLVLLACDQQGGSLQTYSLRLSLDGAVVFADPTTRHVRILDVSAKSLKPESRVHEAAHAVKLAELRKGDHDQALLFLRDKDAGDTKPAEFSDVALLSKNGFERTIAVDPKFGSLQQSQDGKYAVLFGSGQTDHLLDNQAEIAVVELDREGEDAVAIRPLDGLGAAPVTVAFAPEMTLDGASTRLLAVLSYDAISLIDLDHSSRRDTTIDLRSVSGNNNGVPRLTFDASQGRIYAVRSSSSDIVVIDLVPEMAMGNANTFRPVLSTLSLPSAVGGVEIYRIGGQPRLLCGLPQQAAVAVVDPVSGDVVVVQIGTGIEQAVTYHVGVDEEDLHALILGASEVSAVSLRDVEAYGSAARVRRLVERRTNARLVMVNNLDIALVVHASGGLSLIDLAAETATPFATTALLTDILVDEERGGAWIAAQGENQVAFLDLESRTQREITLDAEVEGLLPVFKHDRVVALHDSPWGYATVIDANQPKESRAKALLGFLATGIAD